MPPRESVRRIKAATVAIARLLDERDRHRPFSIVGSGFCIDPCGIIVTCRHVFDAFQGKPTLEQIKETTGEKTPDGRQLLAPVQLEHIYAAFYAMRSDTQLTVLMAPISHIVARTDHDLALLRIDPESRTPAGGYPVVDIAEPEDIGEGDDVGTCGFPLGEQLHDTLGTVTSSFTRGIVSSVIPSSGIPRSLIRAFQLDLGAAGGNSGGPVFQWETGRVFGVLEAGLGHLTRAVALHHLLETDTLEAMRRAEAGKYPALFDPPSGT